VGQGNDGNVQFSYICPTKRYDKPFFLKKSPLLVLSLLLMGLGSIKYRGYYGFLALLSLLQFVLGAYVTFVPAANCQTMCPRESKKES
jgi:hypothetical protein